MANRTMRIFQTTEDVLDLIKDAQSNSSHRILCLSSKPEDVFPQILTKFSEPAHQSFVLCREDFAPYVECFANRRDRFIDVSESPVILVETSRLIGNEFKLGRYWFRTLKIVEDQGQLSSVNKNDEFIKWADLVLSIARRKATKIKISDHDSVYALARAKKIIEESVGTFDAQNNYVIQISNTEVSERKAAP